MNKREFTKKNNRLNVVKDLLEMRSEEHRVLCDALYSMNPKSSSYKVVLELLNSVEEESIKLLKERAVLAVEGDNYKRLNNVIKIQFGR